MVMTLEKEDLLRTYCGMSPLMAKAFWNFVNAETVNPETVQVFRDNNLIDSCEQITIIGKSVYRRIAEILGGDWNPPAPVFVGPFLDELETLELHALKHPSIQAHGLRQVHLKVLRALALRPRQVYGALRDAYGEFALDELLAMEMIQCTTTQFSQVVLSNKGSAFVASIVAAHMPAVKINVVVG